MRCQRDSALIALAKARIWESEGWEVVVADDGGRSLGPAQLDAHVAAYRALDAAEAALDDDLIGPRLMPGAALKFGDRAAPSSRGRSAREAAPA
ncbi:hypothetical protein BJ123_104211 [Rhodopseudomonas thermotolerans]|uniref:Uncharacterized protein n=3 Tax=Nitrobacteraceae TaxID=41294 RepID=A0A336JJM0_9BRAD|nr:hypothetical protein BJ125_104211 [Rhodopseudomonas pentothenatexigens]REG06042.1 hypothetical protein BJ123_104211 [Rhodopseudomonas thermotolerans]SSW89910.1 hypothetical protein SAMN05892882_104211 [Rhodopseudomonas pentothenatexigens]